MHYSCRLFIGNSPSCWSQYWENEPDDNLSAKTKGHLFGLISATDNEIGRQILSEVTNNYFSSTCELPTIPNGINMALAIVKADTLNVTTSNTQILFKRGDRISFIPSNSTGQLRDGDQFMMLTNRFIERFTLEKIKQYLSQSSLQLIEESFLADLNSFDDQSNIAAALIEVHVDDNPEVNITIPTSDIIIEPIRPKKIRHHRQASLVLISLLLISLVVSIVYGSYINHTRNLEKQYQTLKSQIEEKIKNSESLKNISLESAGLAAKEAQDILKQIKNHPTEIAEFNDKINKLLVETGSSDSLDGKLYYDTQTIFANNNFSKMTLLNNQLILLDTTVGRVDSLGIPDKNKSKLAQSDEIKEAISLAPNGNNLYLMTPTNIYSLSNGKLTSVANLKDLSPIDFEFYNGLLYLLDTKSIYKFTKSSSDFISPAVWLKDKQSLPEDSTSLAINGKLWVLSSTGKLTSYLRGVEEKFTTTSDESYVYTSNLHTYLDTQKLVFSDKNNIYVFQKDGKLLSKFSLKDKTVRDIAVNFAQKSLYVLASDQKIYIITLP